MGLVARSIGGLETCIELPALRLCFDLGRCPPSAVHRPLVLFTHAHMDHLGGIAYHAATRALLGLEPPTYVVPPHAEAALADLFAAWRRLDESRLPHRLVPLGPGESFALAGGLRAEAFATPHTVPSQGYALVATKRKLKPELRGLPQAELDDLRTRGGIEITREEEDVLFAFTGDTRAELLEQEPLVRRARVLVMECTFLDERVPLEQARASGHVHLDELVERADLLGNEAILLTHLSARYTQREALALYDAKLPPELRARVTPLLDGHKP